MAMGVAQWLGGCRRGHPIAWAGLLVTPLPDPLATLDGLGLADATTLWPKGGCAGHPRWAGGPHRGYPHFVFFVLVFSSHFKILHFS
jgi:hypothetical protein